MVVNDLINDKIKTAFENTEPNVEVVATVDNGYKEETGVVDL